MVSNPYIVIILISILVILSYIYSAVSIRTRIPAVLLLLFTGVAGRILSDRMGYTLPPLGPVVEFFGVVGLILIVLEGTLELRLKKEKLWLLFRAFLSAAVILFISAFSIAKIMQAFYSNFSFYTCLINAIPLAVISSAIAIPSVTGIHEDKKEFIIYESIFSDILGIIFFNAVVENPTFEIHAAAWFAADFAIIIAVSVIFTVLILYFIEKTTMNIKFFLLIAIMVMLYSVGKILHMPALVMILIFGLIFNNLDLLTSHRVDRYLDFKKLNEGIDRFRMITNESAFLIRTLFFFIFGFTFQLIIFADLRIIFTGAVIVVVLYFIRFIYLKLVAHRNLFPEFFIAPRGLITILLFYAIPEEYSNGVITEGVLFFVILVTSLIMMLGLMGSGKKPPAREIFIGKQLAEDITDEIEM